MLSAFSSGITLSSGQVVALTGFGKDKALRVLKDLWPRGWFVSKAQAAARATL